MSTVEEKYDQHKMDSLKRYLQKEQAKGRGRDYEIIIDNFKIVPRTNDAAEFEDYEPEINENTKKVCVLIYDSPKNNRNTNYTFLLQGEFSKKEKQNGLGEIEQLIQEKLDAKDKEYEFRRMKEDLDEKTRLLEDSVEYSNKLEEQIEAIKKGKLKGLLQSTEAGGVILQGLLGGMLKKIPGAQGIAGLLGVQTEDTSTPETETVETEASFKRKGVENPNEQDWEMQLKSLMSKFSDEDREDVLAIFKSLSENPKRIGGVITILNIKND